MTAPATPAIFKDLLLEGIPLEERTYGVAGITTNVLEGGDGIPLVLLHGPGESSVNWRWVASDLVITHRVVAPDLPAHGETETGPTEPAEVVAWLGELIDRTCATPPIVVGHVIGGAIAARFAIEHSDRLRHLVLVDSLGLARFRPSPRFAVGFMGFVARPNERSYDRFMHQCSYDLDQLRDDVSDDWEPFARYNIALAQSPKAKEGGKLFRKVGVPRLPPDDLARIDVPTTLIWGRHDRALRLKIAEAASQRYGWPLHIIERSADDPIRDQPAAFLAALRTAIDRERTSG